MKSFSSVYVLVDSLWVSQGRLITNVVGWIRGLIMKGKPFFIVKKKSVKVTK